MADDIIWVFAGLGFGIFLFISGFRWFWQKRLIENTPTSKIRSIAMGPVEISGEVVPAEKQILKSPFTGKDCVYYRFKIEEYRKSKNSSYWQTVRSGEKKVNFYLKYDTGSVLVDPEKAKIDIPSDYCAESGFGKPPVKMIQEFLAKESMNHKNFFGFNRRLRYTEYYIAPKDKLYIMGTAGDNPFVEEATGQKNEEDIMLQKGKSFYYISDKPEKDVLKSFRWKVIGGLWGGSGLIIVCLFILFWYFHIL